MIFAGVTRFFQEINSDDPIRIRKSAARKTYTIRIVFATLFSLLIYYLIESNSVNYSVFDIARNILTQQEQQGVGDAKVTKAHFKDGILLVIFFIGLYRYSFLDPFSNIKRLDNCRKSLAPRTFIPIPVGDLFRYSKLLPSNRLPNLCMRCDVNSKCSSVQTSSGDFLEKHSLQWWRDLYEHGIIKVANLKRLTQSVLICRTYYFSRRLALDVFFAGAFVFTAHRVFEVVYGMNLPLPVAPLSLTLGALGFFTLIPRLVGSGDGGNYGPWAKLESAVESIAVEFEYPIENAKTRYIPIVCGLNGKYKFQDHPVHQDDEMSETRWYRALAALIAELDSLVINKLATVINSSGNGVKTSSSAMANDYHLISLNSYRMFYQKYYKSYGAYSLHESNDLSELLHEKLGFEKHFVSKMVKTVSSKLWLCINKDGLASEDKNSRVGSAFITKISFDSDQIRSLRANVSKNIEKLENRNFGWVVLCSSNQDCFTDSTGKLHYQIAKPFILRAAIEKSRNII